MSEPFLSAIRTTTPLAVSSALDEVTEGINAASKEGGIAEIESAIESFSAMKTDIPRLDAMVRPGEMAGISDPAEYLKQLSGEPTGSEASLFPSRNLVANLENPEFNMTEGLAGFVELGLTEALAGKDGLISALPIPPPESAGEGIALDNKGGQVSATPIEIPYPVPDDAGEGIALDNKNDQISATPIPLPYPDPVDMDSILLSLANLDPSTPETEKEALFNSFQAGLNTLLGMEATVKDVLQMQLDVTSSLNQANRIGLTPEDN